MGQIHSSYDFLLVRYTDISPSTTYNTNDWFGKSSPIFEPYQLNLRVRKTKLKVFFYMRHYNQDYIFVLKVYF